jgi:hypothetical protein
MTDVPASVNSEIPRIPVVEPINQSFSDALRANAQTVKAEAEQAGKELTGIDALAVIQSTSKAAEPGGERFSTADILSGDKPAETPAETVTPEVTAVDQASASEAPVEPGLEPTEQSLIELKLSTINGGLNPGLVETAEPETTTLAPQPDANPISIEPKKFVSTSPVTERANIENDLGMSLKDVPIPEPEPEHHKWLRWKNIKQPQKEQPAQSATPTETVPTS